MRKRVMTITWIAALAAIPALPALMLAQKPGQHAGTPKTNVSAPADPQDLSGMWEFFNGLPGHGIYATPS